MVRTTRCRDRAAAERVAFIVSTSACWRESELARREDVGEGLATVLLRGTKRKTRFRTVPIVSPGQRSLLEYAVEHAQGTGGVVFRVWRNARRDLLEAQGHADAGAGLRAPDPRAAGGRHGARDGLDAARL